MRFIQNNLIIALTLDFKYVSLRNAQVLNRFKLDDFQIYNKTSVILSFMKMAFRDIKLVLLEKTW